MFTLYNTLTRQKELFEPIEQGKVGMYVCGPTVYDVPHIGHARSAYVFDMLRRYLVFRGFEVFFVRNVTDVDDKIISRARSEQGSGFRVRGSDLREKTKEIAAYYLDIYHRDMEMMGFLAPTFEPKATENIPCMIEFIEKLIQKGYAYAAHGDVYFDVDKFAGYGKLSNQNEQEMLHGMHIGLAQKKNPLDFALWKTAKENEPFWDSPWGPGRPGWHIECSAMSTRLLGAGFDIHGGGLDLIFPHHENEIAQSEAATGNFFAKYWVHNGLLTVRGEKMSKSLGNYITISDFFEKYEDADLLKIVFLSSHYRSSLDYSDERVNDAKNIKDRIMIFLDKTSRILGELNSETTRGRIPENVAALRDNFFEKMDDDLNTPQGLKVLFEAVKTGNNYLQDANIERDEKLSMLKGLNDLVLEFANIFGLGLTSAGFKGDETRRIEELVDARENARKNKEYAVSDSLRTELMNMGVIVEDTPEGPRWRKKA